jgi:hypothetical protein
MISIHSVCSLGDDRISYKDFMDTLVNREELPEADAQLLFEGFSSSETPHNIKEHIIKRIPYAGPHIDALFEELQVGYVVDSLEGELTTRKDFATSSRDG